jgi:hypothetical protein
VRDDPDGLAEGLNHFLGSAAWPPAGRSQGWDEALAPVVGEALEMAR